MCLRYDPNVLCIGVIALAIRQQKLPQPVKHDTISGPDTKPWYEELFGVKKETIEIIEDMILTALEQTQYSFPSAQKQPQSTNNNSNNSNNNNNKGNKQQQKAQQQVANNSNNANQPNGNNASANANPHSNNNKRPHPQTQHGTKSNQPAQVYRPKQTDNKDNKDNNATSNTNNAN